ncbi:hypothetical protein SCA6_016731 [Theobroma cacao]
MIEKRKNRQTINFAADADKFGLVMAMMMTAKRSRGIIVSGSRRREACMNRMDPSILRASIDILNYMFGMFVGGLTINKRTSVFVKFMSFDSDKPQILLSSKSETGLSSGIWSYPMGNQVEHSNMICQKNFLMV